MRTAELTFGGSCQAPVIKSGMRSDLRPVERGYFIGLEMVGEHLLSVCILDHKSPFVVPSGVRVNIEEAS